MTPLIIVNSLLNDTVEAAGCEEGLEINLRRVIIAVLHVRLEVSLVEAWEVCRSDDALQVLVRIVLHVEVEVELGSLAILRVKIYVSLKMVHNELTDDEAKADALRVDLLLLVLNTAKQLEQLRLILIRNAHSLVSV